MLILMQVPSIALLRANSLRPHLCTLPLSTKSQSHRRRSTFSTHATLCRLFAASYHVYRRLDVGEHRSWFRIWSFSREEMQRLWGYHRVGLESALGLWEMDGNDHTGRTAREYCLRQQKFKWMLTMKRVPWTKQRIEMMINDEVLSRMYIFQSFIMIFWSCIHCNSRSRMFGLSVLFSIHDHPWGDQTSAEYRGRAW